MKNSVLLITLLGCARLVGAQQPDVASEADFLTDMPVVLSVSRLPQRLDETPGAVTLIDREMIRLSGARDVADLLRLVPGFQSSSSFETDAPQASYHGAFGNYSSRMQVLVDGRSVYSPYFVGTTGLGLQTVAMADIERIEVLRGSNSAAYGARAVLGVVNIVTRHTLDTLGGQVGLASGQNGILDAQAQLGWGGDNGSFRLSVDRRGDLGLSGANGHNQVERVNFRADLRPSARDEVQFQAGGVDVDAGRGFLGNVGNPPRDSFWGSSYMQVDWRRNLGPDEDLTLGVSHTTESFRDQFAYSLIPLGVNDSMIIDSSGDASIDTVSLQHTFRYSPAVRVVWGGEWRREQVVSKALYNIDGPLVSDFTRLFGNVEWRMNPEFVLNAGAMAERSSVNGDSLAPRVMLNWHATPSQTWRVGVSQAFRPPSTFEKFADVRYVWHGLLLRQTNLASGNVVSEKVTSRELGYLGSFPERGLSLDVRLFQERVSDFTKRQQIANRPNVYDYVNGDNFDIQGLEYQLKWQLMRGTQVIFNQAMMAIKSADPGNASAAPVLASSLTLFQKLPGNLDLSLMIQDAGDMSLPGGSFGEQNWLTRTDLRLGIPLRLGASRGELALVVQNANLPFADYKQLFQFQRRAFVTLRLDY